MAACRNPVACAWPCAGPPPQRTRSTCTCAGRWAHKACAQGLDLVQRGAVRTRSTLCREVPGAQDSAQGAQDSAQDSAQGAQGWPCR